MNRNDAHVPPQFRLHVGQIVTKVSSWLLITCSCQDVVMGPPDEPNHDVFIADAISQTGLNHDTAEALNP
ncbi:hypothetical protein PCASD_25215 [Puccinia coronata f. sp. avenae]|uniref:Uncharacterized protein n=1 Tax=Puccinia coronata f. sp. avenae TaxID=200324 RepID=A0A2N5TL98_9BASI|nr:hypothetical protein PCASD_25215 [Puccinia coronata f. sp. avenae]